MIRADLVTVFHNEDNYQLHLELFEAIQANEPAGGYRLIGVDNRRVNRGFAPACNIGAFHPDAQAPVIGFLNPDVRVKGPFLQTAVSTLSGNTVITGCRFGKPDRELKIWGVRNWVCGATLFVTRKWFTSVGGFDTQFVWAWEETDLIRRAEAAGLVCQPCDLPLHHESPPDQSAEDAAFKQRHFERGAQIYRGKWKGRR